LRTGIAAAEANPMSAPGQDGRPLIVLLEEEAHERLALVQHLTGAGFSVLEAETSDQAVSLLKRTADVKGFVSDAHVGRDCGGAIQVEPEEAVV
jgi:CheY-like chemotaxis protein